MEEYLPKRVGELKTIINGLIVELLANGVVPQIRPGVPMAPENIFSLRRELEQIRIKLSVEKGQQSSNNL